MSDPLDRVISPAAAVEKLLKAGVNISERVLRERARAIGAYRQVGRGIFFLPEDLERIMEPKCSSPSNAPARRSTSPAARSRVAVLSEARAKLEKAKRKSDA